MVGGLRTITRSASKAAEEATSLLNRLKTKKAYYVNKIKNLYEEVNDNAKLQSYTKGQTSEVQKEIEKWSKLYDSVMIEANCDLDMERMSTNLPKTLRSTDK